MSDGTTQYPFTDVTVEQDGNIVRLTIVQPDEETATRLYDWIDKKLTFGELVLVMQGGKVVETETGEPGK
jgi:nucleoside diphosphate kinase